MVALRLGLAVVLGACLAAPASAEAAASFDPAVARRITPAEVHKRTAAGEQAVFLDTRRNTGDEIVQGAVHVPNDDGIEAWAKGASKDALIVAYCT